MGVSVQGMGVVGEDGGQMVKGLSGQAKELGFYLIGIKVPLKDFHCKFMSQISILEKPF